MKKFITSLILLLSLSSGCQSVKPDAGEVGVLVKKPWIFGSGGVSSEIVQTGREYTWLSTDIVYVTIRPEQHAIQIDDTMSRDGVPLDFDCTISTRITDAPTLIQNFGESWFDTNVRSQVTSFIRDAVKKHAMNETAISTEAMVEIDNEVTERTIAYINEIKLPVELIRFTAGRANPPDSVKNQRMETAAQQQRIVTEQQKVLAEQSRMAAELARANADMAYQNAMKLSSEQFIELQRLKVLRDACTGEGRSCNFVVVEGGNQTLQFPMKM